MANDRIYSRRKREKKAENEVEKLNQTDPFPVCSQQPRSRTDGCPKRRTDFSLFFSQRSPLHPDIESPGSKDGSCIVNATSQDGSPGNQIYPGNPLPLVPCHQHEYAEEGEAKSTRTMYKLQSEIEMAEEIHPCNFMGAGQEDICERTLDHRFNSSEDTCEDLISDECASASAAASISWSEDGSPSGADACPSEQPVDHPTNCSTKVKSERLGQRGINEQESGRGKRRRKPKVHFDDSKHSVESAKNVRRLRIMRQLGLAPPAGSPFSRQ